MEKLPPNNINSSLKFWEIVAVKINLSQLKQAAVFKRKPYLEKKLITSMIHKDSPNLSTMIFETNFISWQFDEVFQYFSPWSLPFSAPVLHSALHCTAIFVLVLFWNLTVELRDCTQCCLHCWEFNRWGWPFALLSPAGTPYMRHNGHIFH